MSARQWVWINLGGVFAFGLFFVLSLITRGHTAFVVLTEIIGLATLGFAIAAIVYKKKDLRWLAISIISYMTPWLVFAIGHEAGVNASSTLKGLWFFPFYITIVAGMFFIKRSYHYLEGLFKLLPAFFLFFHSILLLYMIALHIWWVLPIQS
ncbi:hypothetical protein [Halobacillus campisalis]|uniref:Uncharacterized protein n=1 Tax=Halobacillus campisalis TaxID=435909 RepID=A0ABW2K1W2_9BACI|nr:hypothetical protein [Halobacillus campisalis]